MQAGVRWRFQLISLKLTLRDPIQSLFKPSLEPTPHPESQTPASSGHLRYVRPQIKGSHFHTDLLLLLCSCLRYFTSFQLGVNLGSKPGVFPQNLGTILFALHCHTSSDTESCGLDLSTSSHLALTLCVYCCSHTLTHTLPHTVTHTLPLRGSHWPSHLQLCLLRSLSVLITLLDCWTPIKYIFHRSRPRVLHILLNAHWIWFRLYLWLCLIIHAPGFHQPEIELEIPIECPPYSCLFSNLCPHFSPGTFYKNIYQRMIRSCLSLFSYWTLSSWERYWISSSCACPCPAPVTGVSDLPQHSFWMSLNIPPNDSHPCASGCPHQSNKLYQVFRKKLSTYKNIF